VNFGPIAIIAVIMAIFGVRIVASIVQNRDELFDLDFTDSDRAQVDQAAFFILIPISVALHELGHATMVWLFGGKVIDFGFYGFAGFVSYEGAFTDTQRILVAAAGVTVNTILAALAFGFVMLKRPPMRAAFNELLVQFTILSIANALIFYPLLDLATGISGGDFRQMYDGGVPWLSAIILVIHLSILAGGYLAFKNERFSAHVAALTGLPPHVRRSFLGGFKLAPGAATSPVQVTMTEAEVKLRSALARVASGWPVPIQGRFIRRPEGPSAIVVWRLADGERTVAVIHERAGSVAVVLPDRGATSIEAALAGRVWQRWSELPSEDDLMLGIRMAMEEADQREPSLFARTVVTN
jgi:hypothetical protein